jgi:hypothetical protein
MTIAVVAVRVYYKGAAGSPPGVVANPYIKVSAGAHLMQATFHAALYKPAGALAPFSLARAACMTVLIRAGFAKKVHEASLGAAPPHPVCCIPQTLVVLALLPDDWVAPHTVHKFDPRDKMRHVRGVDTLQIFVESSGCQHTIIIIFQGFGSVSSRSLGIQELASKKVKKAIFCK